MLDRVLDDLKKAGVAFETVPDLCELAARGDNRMAQWASGQVKIAACFPRAIQWLFAAARTPLGNGAEIVNLRVKSAEDAVATILSPIQPHDPLPGANVLLPSQAAPPPADWPAWFPVIDYDRCAQCMQCLGFCLFGVYGVDGSKRIEVTNPAQCKTNCPACARVCPHGAIIFPKHRGSPINGDNPADAATSMPKLDISTLLGGDAHSILRDRSARAKSQGRFSKERSGEEALSERRKYLALQGMIAEDIPPEVISSLPSPEIIAKKVEEAAARAKAAIEARERL